MSMSESKYRYGAVAVSALLALGTVAAVPSVAEASTAQGSQNDGSCSKGSHWWLRADPQNGRIRVEGEVKTGIKGQHWTWRILHNGDESAHGSTVTKGGDGDLKITRTVINLPGVDTIGWRANNSATGERCKGSVRY